MKQLTGSHFETPLGVMIAVTDELFLYLLEFENRKNLNKEILKLNAEIISGETAVSKLTERQLTEYFAGERQKFHLPLQLTGTTFQQKVWQEVTKVRFGTKVSYKMIAERIGQPSASMAVGAANGANQFAIVVPCHRLVRADGGLAGYAAGLDKKKALLEFENAHKH